MWPLLYPEVHSKGQLASVRACVRGGGGGGRGLTLRRAGIEGCAAFRAAWDGEDAAREGDRDGVQRDVLQHLRLNALQQVVRVRGRGGRGGGGLAEPAVGRRYGESEHYTRALFTLARKMAPSVIFIVRGPVRDIYCCWLYCGYTAWGRGRARARGVMRPRVQDEIDSLLGSRDHGRSVLPTVQVWQY